MITIATYPTFPLLNPPTDRQGRPGDLHVEDGGERPEGARLGHAAPERGARVQRAADARGRALYGQQEALPRRPVLAELRRGGGAVCQHAQLFRLLLGGNGQQSGPGVFAVSQRSDIGL